MKPIMRKAGCPISRLLSAIIEKAIADSQEYDEDIRAMSPKGQDAKEIYEAVSRRDVQSAAGKFRPL